MNKYRGFTIVELLIVIVVLGVLVSLIIFSYNGIQERAHSAKRSADKSVMMKWLEQYYSENGFYPASATGSSYLVTPSRITSTTTKAQLRAIMGTSSAIQDPIDNSDRPFISSGYTTTAGHYFYFGGYFYNGAGSTVIASRFGTIGILYCSGNLVLNTTNRYAASVFSYYDKSSNTIQIFTTSNGVKPTSLANPSRCIWH